jgi:hypothetical protein
MRKTFTKIKSLINLPQDAHSRLNTIVNDLIDVATDTERTHYSMDEDFGLGYLLVVLSFSTFLDSCPRAGKSTSASTHRVILEQLILPTMNEGSKWRQSQQFISGSLRLVG